MELPLVLARVLSNASRENANSKHALWPIRASYPTCANQGATPHLRQSGRLSVRHAQSIHTDARLTSRKARLTMLDFFLILNCSKEQTWFQMTRRTLKVTKADTSYLCSSIEE